MGLCQGQTCGPPIEAILQRDLGDAFRPDERPVRWSLARYETLGEELGEATGFRRCGSWLVAASEEEWEALGRSTEERRAAGLSVSRRGGEEVREAEPALGEAVVGGGFCETDGQIHPWRTALAFAHAAKRLGARLELGVEATGVEVQQGRAVGVATAAGVVEGGAMLLAAGAWTARLCEGLGVELGLRPRRGEILVTEPMPPLLSSVIVHAPYVSSKLGRHGEQAATMVLEQTEDGDLLMGSTREFAGLRPCSGDGLPLVGPVAEVEWLFVATGHEGDGVALAPVTGEIVAEGLLEGEWRRELLPRVAVAAD